MKIRLVQTVISKREEARYEDDDLSQHILDGHVPASTLNSHVVDQKKDTNNDKVCGKEVPKAGCRDSREQRSRNNEAHFFIIATTNLNLDALRADLLTRTPAIDEGSMWDLVIRSTPYVACAGQPLLPRGHLRVAHPQRT